MTDTIVIVSGAGEQGPAGPPSLDVGDVVVGRGQIPVGDASGNPTVISPTGSTGKFLKGGTDPAWTAIAEADVTNLTTDLAAKAPLAGPTFTGTVTAAAVTATGDVALGDADGDLTTVRRMRRKSVKPSITATPVGTYPAAGTTPTVTNFGSDGCGEVRVTVGSATGLGSGALFNLVFASAKPDTNYGVRLENRSLNARARVHHISSVAADGFTVSIDAPSATDDIRFFYFVDEWEEA